MAIPLWIGVGSIVAGTGSVVPSVPGTTDDTLLLFVESADQAVSTPTGWLLVGHTEVAGQTRLTIFTRRKNAASETGPTVSDPGDHVLAFIAAVRNASGKMHLVLPDSGSETGTNQTETIDGSGTTTVADCLMLVCSTHSVDDANVSFSAWTNADFANINERVDTGTTQGNGGGIGLISAEKATAGAFGATTVVNARLDPHWAAFVLAVAPKNPPANDNFANATLLVDGNSPEEGITYDAGTESGEPLSLTGSSNPPLTGFPYDRTQWWKYTAPSRHIVNFRILSSAFLVAALRVWRGSAVNALTQYATPSSSDGNTHFGEDSGRGQLGVLVSGTTNPASLPFRVQADPGTELYIQTGRLTTGGTADQEYDVEFYFLDPPTNDDFADAEFYDLTPPTPDDLFTTLDLPFDLEGATGEEDSPQDLPHVGDIWYRFTTDSPVVVGIQHVKDNFTDNVSRHGVYVYSGDDVNDLTLLSNFFGAGASEADDPLHQVQFNTGTTYYIQVFGAVSGGSGPTIWTSTLHLEQLPKPDNDDFDDAEDLGTADSGSTLVASTVGSTFEIDEPVGWNSGDTVWYKFSPVNGGWYEITYDTLPPAGSFWSVSAYRGADIDSLEYVSGGLIYQATDSDTFLSLRGGDTYYLQLQVLFDTPPHDFVEIFWDLVEPSVATNDDRANIEVVAGASGTLSSQTIAGATREVGESTFTSMGPLGEYYHNETSIWYEWVCPASDKYIFGCEGLTPEAYAVYMHVWDDDPAVFPQIAVNFNGDVDVTSRIVFDAIIGETYTIMVQLTRYSSPVSGWPGPYTFDLVWDTYVPATDGTFADAIPVDAFHTDSLPMGETYGQPLVPEVGTPDVMSLLEAEGFTQFGHTLWYAFTPQFSGTYTFELESPGSQVFYAWYEGTSLEDLEGMLIDGFPAIGFTDAASGPQFLADVELVAATTYYILFGGFQYDPPEDVPLTWTPQGQFTFSWTKDPPENDAFASVQGGSPSTPGNLNWFDAYSYGGTDYGPGFFFPSGGCRRFSNVAATAEVGEPANPGGFAATRTIWVRWQPPVAGDFRIWVEPIGPNPVLDPLLAVYDFNTSFGALGVALAYDDDTNGLYPEVTYTRAFANDTVLIQIDARDEGEFLLRFQYESGDPPPVNDDFDDAIELTDGVLVSGDPTGGTVECGETPPAGFWGGPDASIWYRFVATDTVNVTATLTSSGNVGDGYALLDIFRGTSLDTLINETPADDFDNSAYNDTTVIPFTMVAGETYYFRITGLESSGSAVDLTIDTANLTPPGNDNFDDATTVTAGTTVGNNDGSTLETGEPDPKGGTIAGGSGGPGSGTTWHKYIAAAPGFLNIWVDRTSQPRSQWYRIGVWEGPSKTMTKLVTCGTPFATSPAVPFRPFYEVREDQTYWIQVIRENDQSWGNYNLHIEEYLETEAWDQTDGFTSTTNSPDTSGDILTCTGSQDVADSMDVLPQYGSVDLGADVPQWGRETRVYCEVRIVGGQILYRNTPYGGDSWANNPRVVALSDDHSTYRTTRLGLLRARDKDGAFAFAVSLAANNRGENFIEFMGETGIHVTPISLGKAVPQHETGWVGIEIVLTAYNFQGHDGSSSASYPRWALHAYVDGRPIDVTTSAVYYIGKQIRYVDFGIYRHPTTYGVATTAASDQRYVENNEAWTTETRNARITNIVPRLPFDVELKGDRGIFEFDGFASEVPWQAEGTRHTFATQPTGAFPVAAVPEKPGWGAFRSVSPGTRTRVTYGLQNGSRRFYCASLFPDVFPATKQPIAGFASSAGGLNATSGGMGVLLLQASGELRIRPYGTRDFCVAHLAAGEHYFIEVHVDAEVMWDVRCTVYINGQSFGEYTNVYTYGQVSALTSNSIAGVGDETSAHQFESFLNFNYLAGGLIDHDLRFTNLVAGRAPGEMLGPVQPVIVGAGTEIGPGHHIPEFPADPDDIMELFTLDNGNHSTLYAWMTEVGPIIQPGPFTVVAAGVGHNRTYPFTQLERFWEEWYRLYPTTALEVAGTEFTKFGQSLPIDDPVTVVGIQVTAPTGGTAQLMKAGSPVGSTDTDTGDGIYGGPADLWGTSWTPEEVNDSGFGVDLTGVAATASEVKIEVFFDDEGGPTGIARGGALGATGLFNFLGDQLVCEWYATGDPSDSMHAAGFWEGGGEPGGTRGPQRVLSGTPQHFWGTAYPLWFWQARGMKHPSIDFIVDMAGDTATVTDYRCVRNPLVYPRFAWSLDDGATWDWVQATDETDSNVLGADVGQDTGGDALFLDNNAALDRFESKHNSWDSGLNQTRPTAASSYRFPYWYLTYANLGTAEPEVLATNLWMRWRPYSGYPNDTAATTTTFRAYAALPDGEVRRVGNYTGGGTEASPALARFTSARAPNGDSWDPATFDDVLLQIGFNNNVTSNSFSWQNLQTNGACVYAATWELLVPADADQPPAGCGGLVSMNWRSSDRRGHANRVLVG